MPSKVVMDVLNAMGASPIHDTARLDDRFGKELLADLDQSSRHPYMDRLSGRIAELLDLGRMFACSDGDMILVLRAYVAAYDSREE
jgi:hypothetical protein